MTKFTAGLGAGFVATVVLSAIMVMKGMMGLMPQLDVIAMLSAMMGAPAIVGWLAHFMIGTLAWGGGFALVYGQLPGNTPVAKGIALGVAAWLVMMVMVMPMAGAGMFGLGLGIVAPMMTLMLHVIFGAVLGVTFARLSPAGLTLSGSPA